MTDLKTMLIMFSKTATLFTHISIKEGERAIILDHGWSIAFVFNADESFKYCCDYNGKVESL